MPRPKKRLGQHFLYDPGILRRIADALEIEGDEAVLEIGPGPGGLTAQLATRTPHLFAIEKDQAFLAHLRQHFPNLTLIHGDALELDWHALVGQGRFRVIGNIPYNITSPLLEKALRPPRPVCIVYLVQREVADRVAALPGTAEYGALSVGVQAVTTVERLFTVPAGAFRPRPKVSSAVLRLRPRPEPLVSDAEIAPFRRFVVGLFGFRRKQLSRALRDLTGAPVSDVVSWLASVGLHETIRPGELGPDTFARLYRAIPVSILPE
ncbi:MAG TPA: 16S rRNA (adenine(1518)-N(6)/adenine(1519)-N(6))-dimethyltransferase RsmA [Gemmatimonadales bacterium]|jgi:16S rRNA (adenine1518-N6/adenine1519-N6)-dimethyltransferase